MLKEKEHCKQCQIRQGVLILILMEHAQRENQLDCSVVSSNIVLILILMEHAQRENQLDCSVVSSNIVLILILMEHAQRVAVIGFYWVGSLLS